MSYGSSYAGGTYNRANGASIHTTSSSGSQAGLAIAARHSSGYVTFHSGGDTERMRIASDGNIGIGITTPENPLQINGSVSELNLLVKNTGSNGARTYLTSFAGKSSIQTDKDFTIRNNQNGWQDRFILTYAGDVGIGTSTPDAKLAVKGQVHAQEVKVDLNVGIVPDYVFDKSYNLLSLDQIKSYIEVNSHLPEIASAKDMEANGLNLGEMNMLLLKKVEELTLYLLQQKEQIDLLEEENRKQAEAIEAITGKINKE